MSTSRPSAVSRRNRRSREYSRKSPLRSRDTSGWGQAEQAPGLGLGDAALAHDGVDAADQFRLEQVGVGVGVTEVGEDVAAAAFDGRVECGHGFYPPPCVFPVMLLGDPQAAQLIRKNSIMAYV